MKTIVALVLVVVLLFGCSQQAEVKKPATVEPKEDGNPKDVMKDQNPTDTKPADTKQAENVKEITATVTHTGFNPNKFTVKVGDTVRIRANTAPGQDWHNHGFTIDEFSVNTAVRSFDTNNPVIIEFVADKAGTFTIYCKTCNDDVDSWKAKTGSKHPDIKATLEVTE